jgi:catechol 2,3-dioxygenase-like lactoylglutathione lyase family enzyme
VTGPLPGPIRQVGFVVADFDAALAGWVRLGVGPWFTVRGITLAGSTWRGQAADPTVSLAFAQSGELQLEVIACHDRAPSPYLEFLEAGRHGLHHLAWWTEDFDAAMGALARAGWPVVFSGRGGALRFAYADPGGELLVEVMELTDTARWLADTVRQAAVGWDGADPVRPLA